MKRLICWLTQRAQKHNVNPYIFIALYLFSFLPFYLGIYLMLRGSGVLGIGLGNLFRFQFKEIKMDNSLVIWGLLINRAAWALPYLYIEFRGKGLRWYFHLLIWGWLLGGVANILLTVLRK